MAMAMAMATPAASKLQHMYGNAPSSVVRRALAQRNKTIAALRRQADADISQLQQDAEKAVLTMKADAERAVADAQKQLADAQKQLADVPMNVDALLAELPHQASAREDQCAKAIGQEQQEADVLGAFLAAAVERESNTSMQQKRKLEMMEGKAMVSEASAGRQQRWAASWNESGMASASFGKMVTPEGELFVLPELWRIIKSFSVPSREDILERQRAWARRIHCQQTLTGHSGGIYALAVTREGLIVTGSYDKTAKVWTREGECLQTLTGHSDWILALAVTREGLIVTGSDDKTAKVWTQRDGE